MIALYLVQVALAYAAFLRGWSVTVPILTFNLTLVSLIFSEKNLYPESVLVLNVLVLIILISLLVILPKEVEGWLSGRKRRS